jgi:hypothetical protein
VAAAESAVAKSTPQYVPLVSKGVRFIPAGRTEFNAFDHFLAYFEVYTPQSEVGPDAKLQVHLRIVAAKDGHSVEDFPAVDLAPYKETAGSIVPVVREVHLGDLSEGTYRLEVQATDLAGHSTPWQAAEFSIR